MKAVVCKSFGPPEDLVVETVDDPVAGEGEIVVDMRATAITFPDTLIIEDRYQFKAAPPFVVGGECAGVVSEVGPGVDGVAVGDEVVGSAGNIGGFAEKVLLPAKNVKPLPKAIDFAQSVGTGYAYGTGHYALKYRGDLQPGETMLVLGASGNVGLSAVELGKVMGARVIAAASSAEKLALCKERGADEVINYNEEDLKNRAKELTGGKGVDMVYDAVGGDYAEAALRALAWRGRFLVIGFTAGIPRIPLNLTLLKGCDVVGVFWGASRMREPDIFDKTAAEVDAMMESGALSPYVSRHYPLDEVPQAMRDMLDRKVLGKIVAVA
jgi:NADPH2:quinone reductase